MMAFVAHGHHYLWDRYWATPPKDRPAEIVKTLAEADSVRGKDGMMPSFFSQTSSKHCTQQAT